MGSLGTLEFSIKRPHVVVFPFPAQGHMNPLVEFAKRLVSKNLHVTFVTTETVRERMLEAQSDPAHLTSSLTDIRIETISDGLSLDSGGVKDIKTIIDLLREVGGLTFEGLTERLNAQEQRVSCIVYDSLLEWVHHIASKFSIPCAFFWTQSCAVYSIYYHYHKGLVPSEGEQVEKERVIPGLPRLHELDMPTFLQPSDPNHYLLQLVLGQFTTISQATWILGNSFHELEAAEIKSMDPFIPIRTVGPLLPSAFLDGNNPQDTDVGAHLWKTTNCIDWLNTKEDSTVVYISFGSLAVLSREQICEIALGLKATGHSFLWVIRPALNKEENNGAQDLPAGFLEETAERGLVVP
ncbi:hypothetical protein KI387_025667 [Taxus chinensis]|uniref:Glycosyltransferase N-terminal domain-containing protein n=1 Tax=Taxus chinensis TaxID=29808 RepID=A0AA38FUF5_TAXCH|nr:hypothetical protein KI387_025667 [Taxus chinensis]